ncbi:DUF3617 domain-containing protein [Stakelama saccharophila]|uniref:DUF3617 family protein n=1 Tax=Stakelama saccharophila TaxID=3075605 RepID=A0ABZ0BAE7_9SPHN|nr:DUF3617 family protein [Stakelama sp. W311]WNO54328.1 DUF3617 family protein [Stakelama sp. W311]
MKRALWVLGLGLPLLTGCGDADDSIDARNASVADVSQQAQTILKQKPGMWRTTTEITDLKTADIVQGSPIDRLMREQMASGQTRSACVSEGDASLPIFARAVDPQAACRYDHIRMGDGTIDALLTCPAADGVGTVEFSQRGSYSATDFDIETRLTRRNGDGTGASTMAMRLTGERTGDCEA